MLFNSSLNIPVQSNHWYSSPPDAVKRQLVFIAAVVEFKEMHMNNSL